MKVTEISLTEHNEFGTPLTNTGTIIIDGVVASCYANTESQTLAHWAFLPLRVVAMFF